MTDKEETRREPRYHKSGTLHALLNIREELKEAERAIAAASTKLIEVQQREREIELDAAEWMRRDKTLVETLLICHPAAPESTHRNHIQWVAVFTRADLRSTYVEHRITEPTK